MWLTVWSDQSLYAVVTVRQQYHYNINVTFTLLCNTMIRLSSAGVKVRCFMLNPANISVCKDTLTLDHCTYVNSGVRVRVCKVLCNLTYKIKCNHATKRPVKRVTPGAASGYSWVPLCTCNSHLTGLFISCTEDFWHFSHNCYICILRLTD